MGNEILGWTLGSATLGEVARATPSDTSKETFNLTSTLMSLFGESISWQLARNWKKEQKR